MKDPALIERLERLHRLLSRSFVRYLVEAARPQRVDEWDRLALEAFERWSADTADSLLALEEVLRAEKVHPPGPSWPIAFAQYHLVSPAYLLGPAMKRMEPFLESVEEEARGLEAWPEEAALVRGILEKEREHLRIARNLDRERPREPPKPGVKKGVSANFW